MTNQKMDMKTRMTIMLVLVCFTYEATAEGISSVGVKPFNAVHDTNDSTASFSMPVQYSMAAPAVASAQLAAASLTSVSPSYNIISTTQHPLFPSSHSRWIPKPFVQRSQPPNFSISGPLYNRRISFSAGYSASEPLFDSYNSNEPQYHQISPPYQQIKSTKIHQSYPSLHQSYIPDTPPSSYSSPHQSYIPGTPPSSYSSPHQSYIPDTPPSSYQQYYEPSVPSKPYFLKHISHYNPSAHNLIDFPTHSYKGSLGGNSNSYYKVMFPLALLGISIPAIGLMYTYLSRRRRRDLSSDGGNYFQPSVNDLQYYLDILQSSIQHFQEDMNNEPSINDSHW
ncbi:hypothetical protein L798_11936 [Zootermopsis nevadensis]|uniref:Uncharacterized protein n=1 Tax=Zootermopsis nevadensis TaxID=136037 RepID=A0A067R449_ZOONE|nr:hypothetical protein L798_11936 [Zootermopsis nevadensis]